MIPPPESPWYLELVEFSLTFDGYAAFGEGLAQLYEESFESYLRTCSLPASVDELRGALFYLQRIVRWNEGFGTDGPTDDQLAFAHAVVEELRRHVSGDR